MKKVISVFLILVLSIQLLPVRQMMGWLLSGQMTEEIVHANDSSKNTNTNEEINKHFIAQQHAFAITTLNISLTNFRHDAEALHIRHADDILTPPPNC
ncbi:MAG: hypothetical protein JST87_17210 [Bacteroidetes bacterium]|nr:hypothetical protein [Bacteroidota bacterium]